MEYFGGTPQCPFVQQAVHGELEQTVDGFGTDGAGTGLLSAMICCHGGDRVHLANHGELTM